MTSPAPSAAGQPGTLSDREIADLAGGGSLITEGFDQRNVKQACYELRAGSVFYEPDDPNLTEASRDRRLSVVAAVALGVASNVLTSLLTFAATRLRRQPKLRGRE